MTSVRLKSGNAVTLAQLRKIIKDGGFNSGAADVDAVGTLVERGGGLLLIVTGTTESFRLGPDPKKADAFRQVIDAATNPAGPMLLSGRVEANDTMTVLSSGPVR